MSEQWEKYVEAAADAITYHPGNRTGTPDSRHPVSQMIARSVLAVVGPMIAEDTRVRMVEAAARAVQREPLATYYEWQPVQLVATPIWHPCAGKDQLVRKLERFGGRGRMRLVGDWDDFPDIEGTP
jgi:hypothetical protein